jgi:hypothetical protein
VSTVPLQHHAHADPARRPVRIDRAQTHGSDLAGEPMDNLSGFIDAYVAVWNEADAQTRRRRIAALWAPDGTTCYRLLDARGHEQIESRVAGSFDRWVRDDKFVFRAVNAVCHHRAVKLNFAMLATNSGKVEARGLAYLLIDLNDRIVHDYQFNPSVHDAPGLAARYLACRNETDGARRRSLIGELWAEDGAVIGEDGEIRGRDQLASALAAMQRSQLAKTIAVSAADRSQHHHNVAHVGWQVAPNDGGLPTVAASALLIFNNQGRIGAAYEFNEATAA